jgi:UDP-N-acetylglucosamine--N-acetylmuramyl-(pentapeptide) pyrophosphoryl-undecaprenol N-acetylglucosamine transferase
MRTLIVAGGGTGGHVLAGVAVADAWKQKYGKSANILFVGARGGIEERLVPRAGYALELLDVGSLNRVSFTRRLKTCFQLPLSFLKSALIILHAKPDAVLGVGGYASGPLVLLARILGFIGLSHARTAVLEQNSIPGMTNRILGKFVHEVFSAFPGTEKHFGMKAIQVTGNPIREAIEKLWDGTSPASHGRSSEGFTIFIFGGSQGAQGINTLVLDSLPFLKARIGEIQIIHQTGEKDYERVRTGYSQAGVHAKVEKFIYEMPEMYAGASLVICRAGSSTLSEVAAAGRASVLIPFPQAADNHQEHNARVFSDQNAAFLLLQGAAKGEDLARVILDLLDHPDKRKEIESNVRHFHRPQAAHRIVSELAANLKPV